ncbi:hypothetical protein ACE6H2_020492 [Prunus campanulata]
MHMLLFNSSKADLQLQSDLPIQFPCSKAEQKCLASFLFFSLSFLFASHAHAFSIIAPTCTNLLLQKFIAGKPPNFTHYVGYKVSCSWGEAHG